MAAILSLPSKEIAGEISKRDDTIASLRRNIAHLTNLGKRGAAQVAELERKARGLEKHNQSLVGEVAKERGVVNNLEQAVTDAMAEREEKAKIPKPDQRKTSAFVNAEVTALKAELGHALDKLKVLGKNNKALHEQFMGAKKRTSEAEALASEVEAKLKEKGDAADALCEALEGEKKSREGDKKELASLRIQVSGINENMGFLRAQLEAARGTLYSDKEKYTKEISSLSSTLHSQEMIIGEAQVRRRVYRISTPNANTSVRNVAAVDCRL